MSQLGVFCSTPLEVFVASALEVRGCRRRRGRLFWDPCVQLQPCEAPNPLARNVSIYGYVSTELLEGDFFAIDDQCFQIVPDAINVSGELLEVDFPRPAGTVAPTSSNQVAGCACQTDSTACVCEALCISSCNEAEPPGRLGPSGLTDICCFSDQATVDIDWFERFDNLNTGFWREVTLTIRGLKIGYTDTGFCPGTLTEFSYPGGNTPLAGYLTSYSTRIVDSNGNDNAQFGPASSGFYPGLLFSFTGGCGPRFSLTTSNLAGVKMGGQQENNVAGAVAGQYGVNLISRDYAQWDTVSCTSGSATSSRDTTPVEGLLGDQHNNSGSFSIDDPGDCSEHCPSAPCQHYRSSRARTAFVEIDASGEVLYAIGNPDAWNWGLSPTDPNFPNNSNIVPGSDIDHGTPPLPTVACSTWRGLMPVYRKPGVDPGVWTLELVTVEHLGGFNDTHSWSVTDAQARTETMPGRPNIFDSTDSSRCRWVDGNSGTLLFIWDVIYTTGTSGSGSYTAGYIDVNYAQEFFSC